MKLGSIVSCLLATGVALVPAVFGRADLKSPLKGVTFQRLAAHRNPEPDVVATNPQVLKSFRGRLVGHNAASALGAAQKNDVAAGYQNISALSPYGTQYACEVLWDDTPVWLLFDTGSSDTWAVMSNFSCVSRAGKTTYPQDACEWGPDFVEGFRYGLVEDIHFALSYGSGETVSGPMGYSDVSVAGITVEHQQVGLANSTYWYGNNMTNGILGMAWPSLTSGYTGGPTENRPANQVSYSPFFTSMVQQGLSSDSFSVALKRNASDGVIAWGGRTGVNTSGDPATTDIIIAYINPSRTESSWSYSYYTIIVDGLQWDTTTDMKKYPYIVDTGTTLIYVPPPLAEAIARSFNPPAIYMYQYGGYFVPCDAITPRIAIIINKIRLWLNPKDLIYRQFADPLTGYCQIAISTGGVGPYVLGAAFLQNVEAVFDVGAAEMRFYPRERY